MNNPSVRQVTTIIDNLKRIEEAANKEGMFDMMQGSVKCGSPACVGGWYMISTFDPSRFSEHYFAGASAMAETLGFKDDSDLEDWADENPEIWGNMHGVAMFTDEEAYNGLTESSKNPMTAVIKHWEAVRDRLQEMKDESTDSRTGNFGNRELKENRSRGK